MPIERVDTAEHYGGPAQRSYNTASLQYGCGSIKVVCGSGRWVMPTSRGSGSSPGRTRTAGELPGTLGENLGALK